MEKPFTTISSKIAWSCPWYSVRQDQIILPNGQPGVYNVVQKAPAVWILPITNDNQVVLIYNYRYTIGDWCWEIPAGSVKPGQSLEEAAREELLEEVGGTAVQLDYGGQFYTANGISNEVGHYFLAQGVSLGKPRHEPAEVMQIHLKPIAEVLQMAQDNAIKDAPSAYIILLCAARLLSQPPGGLNQMTYPPTPS